MSVPLSVPSVAFERSPGRIRLAEHAGSAIAEVQPLPKIRRSISAASGAPVLQRYPDEDNELDEGESGSLDDFLVMNVAEPEMFTALDYATLGALFDTMIELNGTKAVVAAWDALYKAADTAELRPGNTAWDTAVDAGADAYEATPVVGRDAAVVALWPGRADDVPGEFATAVRAAVDKRVTDRAKAIADQYQAYVANNRLLPGTIYRIKAQLVLEHVGGADIIAVQARLALVHARQATVTRETWLTFLGIAGKSRKGTKSVHLHYTAFNDAVTKPLDDTRVDQLTVGEIMDELFGKVDTYDQIHATRQIGSTRYHRYYDGTYTPNDPNDTKLNAEYALMIAELTAGVQRLKDSHGRTKPADGTTVDVGP